MLRREWRFVAAAIGLTILALVYGLPLLADHYQNAYRAERTAAEEYEESKRIAPFGPATEGQYANPEAYREEHRAERDLEAQQDMAWWAMWLLGATLLGVVLLAATLYETRRAAHAALEMVDENKRTYIADHPPKLSINQVAVDLVAGAPMKGQLMLSNEGYTEARGRDSGPLKGELVFELRDSPLPQRHVLQDQAVRARIHYLAADLMSLAPGVVVRCEFDSATVTLTADDLKRIRIKGSRRKLFVLGLIRYTDSEELGVHSTLFCRQYNPETDRFEPVDDSYYEWKSYSG